MDRIASVSLEKQTFTPKQLKIDEASGKLYWSDREGMRVMRSNMDGSNIETTSGLTSVTTLTFPGNSRATSLISKLAGSDSVHVNGHRTRVMVTSPGTCAMRAAVAGLQDALGDHPRGLYVKPDVAARHADDELDAGKWSAFHPFVLVVPVGASVSFPNNDNTQNIRRSKAVGEPPLMLAIAAALQ